jgi:hypothetical protein
MSDVTWGLPDARPARQPQAGKAKGALSPKVAASAHSGIVWLHLSALALWLAIAGVLGAVQATGRDVPVIVFVACLAAAAGHGIFLLLHTAFAAAARRRQAQASRPPAGA